MDDLFSSVQLPLIRVLEYLDAKSLIQIGRVNSVCCSMHRDNGLWKSFCSAKACELGLKHELIGNNYYDIYRELILAEEVACFTVSRSGSVCCKLHVISVVYHMQDIRRIILGDAEKQYTLYDLYDYFRIGTTRAPESNLGIMMIEGGFDARHSVLYDMLECAIGAHAPERTIRFLAHNFPPDDLLKCCTDKNCVIPSDIFMGYTQSGRNPRILLKMMDFVDITPTDINTMVQAALCQPPNFLVRVVRKYRALYDENFNVTPLISGCAPSYVRYVVNALKK